MKGADTAMVMPMAGEGSRFAREGILEPKPLIDLFGRPFFWWATESLRRSVPVAEMVFVVLAKHCRKFGLGERVLQFYPDARIVEIPEVTAGAAETAAIGLKALNWRGPVAINDCDHAFRPADLRDVVRGLNNGAQGALLGFRAQSPAYSYVKFGLAGAVTGTVEKQVASPFAIAGCYFFSSPEAFTGKYERYRDECPYQELFLSGLYNRIIEDGGSVLFQSLTRHVSFGVPEERARVGQSDLDFLAGTVAE